MIVDADCHISSAHWDALAITADDLIPILDGAGVERALIWLKPPYDKQIEPENRAVYAATRTYAGRFYGFGWANPRLGAQRAADTIRQCFEEYGLAGLKFNGAQDDYVIDDDRLVLPLIEKAAAYGKPLAFHIGADFYENTHPYRLKRIATLFPETRFLMVHMGGAGLPALDRAATEAALACPNITLIASAINERPILRAIQTLGSQRVCFGSDTPFGLMHVRLAMMRAILRDFPAADQEAVLGQNLMRVLQP